jgi:hypothetical protein
MAPVLRSMIADAPSQTNKLSGLRADDEAQLYTNVLSLTKHKWCTLAAHSRVHSTQSPFFQDFFLGTCDKKQTGALKFTAKWYTKKGAAPGVAVASQRPHHQSQWWHFHQHCSWSCLYHCSCLLCPVRG